MQQCFKFLKKTTFVAIKRNKLLVIHVKVLKLCVSALYQNFLPAYQLDAAVEGITKQSIEKEQSAMLYKNMGLKDMPQMMAMFSRMGKLLQDGCRIILRNKEFLKWLEDEKFDVAYTHIYSTCPLGLIHHAKIPSWVWLNSGPLMDYVSQAVGVPILPSYVPPVLMASHDEMGFVQRTKSFIGHVLMSVMHRRYELSQDFEKKI